MQGDRGKRQPCVPVLHAPVVLRLFAVLALVAASALAQTLTRPPTLVTEVEPAPPDGGVTTPGTVVMEVDAGPDGKVLEVKVVGGVSPGLDAAATVTVGAVTVIVAAQGSERFGASETLREDERTEMVSCRKPTGAPSLETVVRTEMHTVAGT